MGVGGRCGGVGVVAGYTVLAEGEKNPFNTNLIQHKQGIIVWLLHSFSICQNNHKQLIGTFTWWVELRLLDCCAHTHAHTRSTIRRSLLGSIPVSLLTKPSSHRKPSGLNKEGVMMKRSRWRRRGEIFFVNCVWYSHLEAELNMIAH